MSSVASASTNQSLDMNNEVYKPRFCGQAQIAEQAHANAYAPKIDAKAEKQKLKDIERLKEEESFAKRHPGLVKALIVAAVLLVVGIFILAAMSKVKSIKNTETATGAKMGDTAIKTIGTTAVVGGAIGLVGAGIASIYNASKDSSTGDMIDKYREDSMQQTIDIHRDLQEEHGNTAKNLATVNGDNAVRVAQAQGDLMVEAINSGQIPIKSDGIRLNEGFGVHNTPHVHEAVEVYDKYQRKDMAHSIAQYGLDNTRSLVLMNNGVNS